MHKTERTSELEQGKGDRNRYPHGASVLPGRAWDKGRGALSGVQCTAGIRQRAAGQMNTRKKFFGMNAQERDAFFASEAVKDFLQRTRDMAMQKRTVTGADLTIPTVVLELIRENIESYSKLVSRVRLRSVSGRGRQNVMGAMPEAVWTEACASLNELDFGFSQTEVDGYKVGGVIYICIATLEDSDYDLASEIITVLGASIGIAVDKAILYGTGVKMPQGIAMP